MHDCGSWAYIGFDAAILNRFEEVQQCFETTSAIIRSKIDVAITAFDTSPPRLLNLSLASPAQPGKFGVVNLLLVSDGAFSRNNQNKVDADELYSILGNIAGLESVVLKHLLSWQPRTLCEQGLDEDALIVNYPELCPA